LSLSIPNQRIPGLINLLYNLELLRALFLAPTTRHAQVKHLYWFLAQVLVT
jgi:hypothetical protein